MKSRMFCIFTTAVVTGGALLFGGCASTEDDRLPPGAYVPPAPKQTPPPANPASTGGMDDIETVQTVQPKTVAVPETEPLPLPPPPRKEETKAPAKTSTVHVVKKGDTFWKLSSVYGVTVKELEEANPKVKPGKLYPGMKLVIPAHSGKKVRPAAKKTAKSAARKNKKTSVKAADSSNVYIVRRGDSLSKIAAKYKIKKTDLAATNKISVDDKLLVGQKLIIPKGAAKPGKAVKKNAPASAKGKKNAKGKKKSSADAKQKEEQVPLPPNKAAAQDSSLPEPPVAPPDLSTLNESAKKPAAANEMPPIKGEVDVPNDIRVEEFAASMGIDVPLLKKYNPQIPANGIIRAGTKVKLP